MNYIEESANALRQMAEADIQSRGELAAIPYGDGSVVHSVGQVSLDGADVFVGLQFPQLRQDQTAAGAAIAEITDAAMIADRAPQLRHVLPAAMGILCVGNSRAPRAVITEDISHGGSLPVEAGPVSEETRRELLLAFLYDGGIGIFEHNARRPGFAYTAGGRERLAGFDPSPFTNRFRLDNAEYHAINHRVIRARVGSTIAVRPPRPRNGLSLVIDSGSPLALAVEKIAGIE
jgi:hypothetical protein